MATIEVDFEVFKELTARRASESVTYNQVIREALRLGRSAAAAAGQKAGSASGGLNYKGVFFPEGTRFRATHKGRNHTGEIKQGSWVDEKGQHHTSPSEAAHAVTKTSINGWRFWECSRPSDPSWILIDNLR